MTNKLIFLIFFNNFNCQNINHNQTDINKILVKKVSPDIETAISVDCNTFELVFKDELELKVINKKSLFFELDKLLQNSNESSEKFRVDSRKQIIIFYSTKNNDTLCLDKFNIALNGKLLKKQNNLKKFLDDL